MNKKTNYMALVYATVLMAAVFSVAPAFAGCLANQGPYNSYGWAKFPFYNGCNESAYVSLCVKSTSGYSNSYYMNLGARSSDEITSGMWDAFHSYRWTEDATQSCPW